MDRNTKYHHANANKRRSNNNIVALKDENGNWCTSRIDLENLLTDHYKMLHTTSSPVRDEQILQCIPSVITAEQNGDLMKVPDEAEILKTLKSMRSWKAPGPDGFPPCFFKSHWEIVGSDAVNTFQQFFRTGFMLKCLNATNITIVPKTKNKQFPSDLRPVALCNTSYKLISKSLSLRMKKLMGKIISPLQAAYVPGRQISDNIQLAQEIVHTIVDDLHNANNALQIIEDFGKASGQLCFNHLYDRVQNRLSAWNGKTMSQCGKSLMIRTDTNTIPSYSMSCLQIPAEIIKKINAAQRDFWWGYEEHKGTYYTSWKNFNLHKDEGGQGFRDSKVLNQALLVREAWRLCTNREAEWVKAMQAKYYSGTSLIHATHKKNYSWAWNGLQKKIPFIKQHSRWRIGQGNQVKIWVDVWILGLDHPPEPRSDAADSESFIWVK
ncbi:uncharacterized protein LOC113290887 [Papaver somniferum]|uniref:uncharacterized protein LOC113290887 n=1 Tax=Papaver somniferum TaxID=3469 RepID=UPI000E700076|nr:uncharacterized protein LOC113290887 [Papaver somniferum]